MKVYETPSKHYFRIHHVRPRFKNDVENVLGYVAFSIAGIGQRPTREFNAALDRQIREYGANAALEEKTIKNWRTEIAALFGMYIDDGGVCRPSFGSVDLANNSDLNRFFRNFVYSFQYPGGHLKPNSVMEMLERGVKFHPGRWLASYFLSSPDAFLTKAEFCHCVFNDLRVTRDGEALSKTIERIRVNREAGVAYETQGDVIRYAGDILDYMVLANLLTVDFEGRYRRHEPSRLILLLISCADNFFDDYNGCADIQKVHQLEAEWFRYVERCHEDFSQQVDKLANASPVVEIKEETVQNAPKPSECDTAQIGLQGERLSLAHEILRVKNAGREDLVHLIKHIPTHLAVGYDIKSIEVDTEFDRMIEVKTTVSKSPLSFNRIHLTTNEWRVAESLGDKYHVYRLQISDDGYKLFVLRNPVRKYKRDEITMIPRDGADIFFPESAGEFVELLCVN